MKKGKNQCLPWMRFLVFQGKKQLVLVLDLHFMTTFFFCNDQQDLDQFVNQSSNKKSSNIKQVSLKYFLLYLYGKVYGYCRIVMTL